MVTSGCAVYLDNNELGCPSSLRWIVLGLVGIGMFAPTARSCAPHTELYYALAHPFVFHNRVQMFALDGNEQCLIAQAGNALLLWRV